MKSRLHDMLCNVGYTYDYDHMTTLEWIHNIQKVIKVLVDSNVSLEQIYNHLKDEGLKNEVSNNLTNWLNDGTLANVINYDVIDNIVGDIRKNNLVNPTHLVTLKGKYTSVLQSFIKLKNGNYIFTQVSSIESDSESFCVNLCNQNGQLLSSMEVVNGGHGAITGYENERNELIIIYTDNNGVLRKTYFIGGHTINNNDCEPLPLQSSDFQLANINKEFNLIMLVNKSNGIFYNGYIYKLDEFLNGQNKVLYTINNIMEVDQTMQGICCDKKYAYVYTGKPGDQLNIRKHDLLNGTYEDIIVSILSDTILEGEGLYINGDELMLGVAKGEPSVMRSNDIYIVNNIENLITNLANTINNSQLFKLTEADGSSKVIPLPNKLSDITNPGTYYFTGEQFKVFTDKPTHYDKVSSGFYLIVSPKSKDGGVYQTIKRNTSGKHQLQASRSVNNGVANEWRTSPEKITLWNGDTRTETEITLKDSIFNYDYVLVQVWSPAGKYTSTLFRSDFLNSDKKMVFNGNNIGDNSTSTSFYGYEMQVTISDDGMTLNQNSKVEIVINPPSENVRRECNVGIYNIQGIRGINNISI